MACPLLEKLPPEIRLQIWDHVVEDGPHYGHPWSSFGHFTAANRRSGHRISPARCQRGILATNRQVFNEISPLFYENVCIVVAHPNQILRWLQEISPRNSACIRHLVIKYHSLLLDFNDQKCIDNRISAWDAALRCMPALLTLTFDFNEREDSARRASLDEYIAADDTVLLNELAKSAQAWSQVREPRNKASIMSFRYRPRRASPEPCQRSNKLFNHALIAIDEDVPLPLQRFFAKRLDTHYTSLALPVTGLPSRFFTEVRYELMSTFAFSEDKSENVSVVLTFQKLPRRPIKATLDDLKFIVTGLPIKYLRLGCRHINSQCLQLIPDLADQIVTLDVAFTDPDPKRVAESLHHVNLHCPALYTVAIAVSPIHDRDPNDPKPEKFFNRKSVSLETAAKWKPFWDKMDEMNAGRVKVWEGEVRYRILKGLDAGLALFGGLPADRTRISEKHCSLNELGIQLDSARDVLLAACAMTDIREFTSPSRKLVNEHAFKLPI